MQQVYADHFVLLGFGAVTPDGYGICYNPQKQQIMFAITSFKKCPTTDTTEFGAMLFEALKEMKNVIISQHVATKLQNKQSMH